MAVIKDNGRFGWAANGITFTGERASTVRRYGPSGDPIKDNVLSVARTRNGIETHIGIVAQEMAGKWFFIMRGCDNMVGGMSDRTFSSRAEAVEELSYRITDAGTIRNPR